jgi:hypothetical protein
MSIHYPKIVFQLNLCDLEPNVVSRDEDELPKSPLTGEAKTQEAPISSPTKPMSPLEKTLASLISKGATIRIHAPPNKRTKKHDANKGINIYENPSDPPKDDVRSSSISFSLIFHSTILLIS